MLPGAILAAALAIPPKTALEQARAMLRYALEGSADVQFEDVKLRKLGDNMLFCGKVNTRMPDGGLTGWRQLVIVVSDDPQQRAVATAVQPNERYIIESSCRHAEPVDRRDYSAALDPHY